MVRENGKRPRLRDLDKPTSQSERGMAREAGEKTKRKGIKRRAEVRRFAPVSTTQTG